MSCQKVLSMLSAYIDGEVQNSDVVTIKTHLSECDSCASEWKALRCMTGMLRTTPEVEPPAFLLAQIEAATVNRTGFLARVKSAFDHVPTTVRWAAAPVAAAIVLFGMLLSNNVGVQTPIALNNPTERIEKSAPGLPNMSVEEQTPARSNIIAAHPKTRITRSGIRGGKVVASAKDVKSPVASPPVERSVSNSEQPVVVEEPKLEEPVVKTEIAVNTPVEPEKDGVSSTPVASEPAGASKVSLGKVAMKTVVLDEPGAIEQLRAKLAANNKSKSKLKTHENIEGRKYSVGLISLRF